jgi:hypothetical protein
MTHETHRGSGRAILALVLAFGAGACVADGDVLQDDASAGEMPDDCTGLDRDGCSGDCVAIWGTPYVDDNLGGWCLFSNGVEYLGCREADSCGAQTASTTTLCTRDEIWRTQTDCIPAEIDAEVCEPPAADAPFC